MSGSMEINMGNAMFHISLSRENKKVKPKQRRAIAVHSDAVMEFVIEEFVFGCGNFLLVDGPTMWCAAII